VDPGSQWFVSDKSIINNKQVMKTKTFTIALMTAILITAIACNRDKTTEGHKDIIALTNENFTEETSTGVILVDFWASWCMPCRAMSPVIREIATQTRGRMKVGKVDIDANGDLANRFRVSGIPTFIIMKDGSVVDKLVGIQSKETLIHALQKHVNLE